MGVALTIFKLLPKSLDYGQVNNTAEFQRILNLPRRQWADRADEAQRIIDPMVRKPRGTMTLFPQQAVALLEATELGGGFIGAGVGTGKTLISLLLPTVLDSQSAVIFVPKGVRDSTLHIALPMLLPHWRIEPERFQVLSYDVLSRESGADILERLAPDLIIADEAHRFARRKSARTIRLQRYLAEHSKTRLIPMSGTITRKGLMDYWHLILWALSQGSPLPLRWPEAQDWADALDVGPKNPKRPGALLQLCNPGESPREGFARRLSDTPGVLITSKTSCQASLTINAVTFAVPDVIKAALVKLEKTWEGPGGDSLSEALDVWRVRRQLVAGFYYRWIWPGGVVNERWLDARRDWHAFVRQVIRSGRQGLDSELQIAKRCASGQLSSQAYAKWKAIKPEYEPKTEAIWLSDYAVVQATKHLTKTPTLVWTEHDAVGRAVARRLAVPYFGAGSTEAKILAEKGRTVVLSIRANLEGKNLQDWAHNLVITPPASGATWEQLLARTHREGQDADEVGCDIFLQHAAHWDAWNTAKEDAEYLHKSLGQEQKLIYATHTYVP